MEHSLIKYRVTHERLFPKKHKFVYNFFWFKISLNNVEAWPTKYFSKNKFNLYSFYDTDHLNIGKETLKDNYIQFYKEQGYEVEIKNITLYTQLRFMGYVFNPVSFVLLEDINGLKHAIVEVGNTFNELKPYFVSSEHFDKHGFDIDFKKFFYISPFIDMDTNLRLKFKHKDDQINVSIDDYKNENMILKVFLKGSEILPTTKSLIKITLQVPFVTLKTIILIHIQAFLLWVKGVDFNSKSKDEQLQKGYIAWKK